MKTLLTITLIILCFTGCKKDCMDCKQTLTISRFKDSLSTPTIQYPNGVHYGTNLGKETTENIFTACTSEEINNANYLNHGFITKTDSIHENVTYANTSISFCECH